MSAESTEQKIARLEKTLATIISIEQKTADIVIQSQQAIVYLMQHVRALDDQNLMLLRFVASSPVFGDSESRSKIRSAVAQAEMHSDTFSAGLRDLMAQLQPSVTPPAPQG